MKTTAKRSLKQLTLPLIALLTLSIYTYQTNDPTHEMTVEPTQSIVSANPENQSVLAGKTMIAFGDSVTEFGHYPEVIANNTGMHVQNIGFKGTRLAHHPNSAYDEFSPTNIVDAVITQDFSVTDRAIQEDRNYSNAFIQNYEQLKTIDFNQVDIVSLLIGTNDYMGNKAGVVSLGESADNTRETFTGAMNYFVTQMEAAFPHIDLVLITPTWRMNPVGFGGESAANQPNANGDYLVDFVDTILERGQHYNLPTLDLYRTSGLNEENHSDFFIDHVHPNKQGYELIGNTISHFLIDTYNNQ